MMLAMSGAPGFANSSAHLPKNFSNPAGDTVTINLSGVSPTFLNV